MISGWLMAWLKAEGNMGSKIETALIAQCGLKPLEKWRGRYE